MSVRSILPFPDFTFDDLADAFYEACRSAWDSGPEEGPRPVPECVVLPDCAFPEIAALQNPLTGERVPVRRVPLVRFPEPEP